MCIFSNHISIAAVCLSFGIFSYLSTNASLSALLTISLKNNNPRRILIFDRNRFLSRKYYFQKPISALNLLNLTVPLDIAVAENLM